MDDRKERIIILLSLYAEDRITRSELDELLGYISRSQYDSVLHGFMKDEWAALDTDKALPEPDWDNMLRSILSTPVKEAKVIRWPKYAAAASILLALSFGGYFLLHKTPVAQQTAQNQKQVIAPGHNQATLTLANGKKIILTKGLNGTLAQQGNTLVQANADAITYTNSKVSPTGGDLEGAANTLSTKRGEASPYPLILADGTKVWLNAASAISFPAAFNGKERLVTLTGEAIFEVKHNAKQPFKVMAARQLIEDIGTTFDVNAYADEPVAKTTLVEGMVKVSATDAPSPLERAGVRLKPGQQSQLQNGKIKVLAVNTADVIAWRSNMFRFRDEPLQNIMRQAARWYDIDVAWENETLKNKPFGTISERFATANQFLHKLELTGEVKFKIEGRKITVMNK